MRAGNALDALFLAQLVELPLRAAFGIGDGDCPVAVAVLADQGAHAGRDLLRPVVPDRRQAGQLDMVEPVRRDDRADLARQRAAGDDENLVRGRRSYTVSPGERGSVAEQGSLCAHRAHMAFPVRLGQPAS